MSEYEPREFAIKGTLHAPESVGAEQLAESLKRGLEQSRLGATVDLGDFTKYATDDAEDEGGCPCDRCGKHHPATTCAESEDKDDLYVEPEPLKEGEWCLIWAQFDTVEPDDDGDVTVDVPGSGLGTQYVRADAIVRPDAGQVPPWVKAVEEPAGLGAVVVVNTNGRKWVRSRPGYADPWQQVGGDGQRRWSDFPADVEVLSEGWTDGAS